MAFEDDLVLVQNLFGNEYVISRYAGAANDENPPKRSQIPTEKRIKEMAHADSAILWAEKEWPGCSAILISKR